MTEAEWLASTNPQAMLTFITADRHYRVGPGVAPVEVTFSRVSPRKLRLFAAACCRAVWPLLTDERSRQAVEVAECFADGLIAFEATRMPRQLAVNVCHEMEASGAPDEQRHPALMAVDCCSALEVSAARDIAQGYKKLLAPHRAAQAALLRDIIGNPFRPVMRVGRDWGAFMHRDDTLLIYERWLTPTVLSLAQAAYEARAGKCGTCKSTGNDIDSQGERTVQWCPHCHGTGEDNSGHIDNARLAVLSDALEEAGCDNLDILGHLRWPGPHVRGCWALDLILGKE